MVIKFAINKEKLKITYLVNCSLNYIIKCILCTSQIMILKIMTFSITNDCRKYRSVKVLFVHKYCFDRLKGKLGHCKTF